MLEAHFAPGMFDAEVVAYANTHDIHPISFSSLSMGSTDLPGLKATVGKVAAAHKITSEQVMYAYVHQKNITVLSTYDPQHPDWVKEDLAIFDIQLSAAEMLALDKLTPGKRTCPDCYTKECQACGQALIKAGCPVGALHGGFIWGRSNPNGTECVKCAMAKTKLIGGVCNPGRGETLETMVPKACQIG